MQDENLIPKSNYLDIRNPVTYRAPLASNTAESGISTTRQIGKSHVNSYGTSMKRGVPWNLFYRTSSTGGLFDLDNFLANQSATVNIFLVNILVGFIVLAIIGVSILIVCLYRSSKQNRFSKSRKSEFDPKETDNQSKSVEDSHDDDLIIKKISIPEEKAKFLPENIWTERLNFR